MRYSQGRLPDFVEKLMPGLQHIESFSRAIASAVQYSPVACLVWGGMWAVIQVSSCDADALKSVARATTNHKRLDIECIDVLRCS